MHLRPSTPPPAPARAALAIAALLALGGCTSSSPTPAATSTATPTATASAPLRVAVTAGDVALEVTTPGTAVDDPRAHVSPGPDASTATVTIDTAALDEDAAGFAGPPGIALASGGTFEPHTDGSVTVREGGAPVGGLSAPRGARLVAVDDTHLEVRAAAGAADRDEVATTLGTAAVAGTDWGDREGGRSLAVTPTAWARDAGQGGVDLVWAELVAADPEVDVPTMHDQLECHAIGARDKATWNLEPWRPDVGLVATMAARCNPTP
ncbi:DUF2599 domain-containing protein [Promicromonospora sp. Marseille-Q5078]